MSQPASQASSHFDLEPISASILAERETARRKAVLALGKCKTDCAEIDEQVLLGGFERGCVVGLSSEEEEMGLQLGLQTLAHSIVQGTIQRALIITPQPAAGILAVLRTTLQALLPDPASLRAHLDRVLLSCIFDLDGLWEALTDLDIPPKTEIQDSQDSASPSPSPEALPDFILITHFSALLTGLFTHRAKPAAHSALQLLSSHARHLSRALTTQPLILILNSTSSSLSTPNTSSTSPKKKPLDATLRSIFAPPPDTLYATAPTRRNKPAFGLVFTQMLDVHLLVGRVEGRWVVECLLDELGRREQRWGVVERGEGGRVRDWEGVRERRRNEEEVTVAGGFGGRRV